ncbi:hypothetical protein C8J56DRAFT_363079 [Mycena floridula]|nr:hypothetical protein C8J56DRAFT_363079 [Mycena floridula]
MSFSFNMSVDRLTVPSLDSLALSSSVSSFDGSSFFCNTASDSQSDFSPPQSPKYEHEDHDLGDIGLQHPSMMLETFDFVGPSFTLASPLRTPKNTSMSLNLAPISFILEQDDAGYDSGMEETARYMSFSKFGKGASRRRASGRRTAKRALRNDDIAGLGLSFENDMGPSGHSFVAGDSSHIDPSPSIIIPTNEEGALHVKNGFKTLVFPTDFLCSPRTPKLVKRRVFPDDFLNSPVAALLLSPTAGDGYERAAPPKPRMLPTFICDTPSPFDALPTRLFSANDFGFPVMSPPLPSPDWSQEVSLEPFFTISLDSPMDISLDVRSPREQLIVGMNPFTMGLGLGITFEELSAESPSVSSSGSPCSTSTSSSPDLGAIPIIEEESFVRKPPTGVGLGLPSSLSSTTSMSWTPKTTVLVRSNSFRLQSTTCYNPLATSRFRRWALYTILESPDLSGAGSPVLVVASRRQNNKKREVVLRYGGNGRNKTITEKNEAEWGRETGFKTIF